MSKELSQENIPLNVKLRQKPANFVSLTLKPRSYQKELSDRALIENVIIYLGTGLGKTFITTLFLNSPKIDELIQDGKKVVFMAPTQDLIKQQADYINKQVRYKIKIFCGRSAHCGEHIDMWSKKVWEEQLLTIDMLFCTPQIFSSAVSTNLLNWSQFAAIIFDEVHHACRSSKNKESGHPYAQVIAHYNNYFAIRPNVFIDPRPRIIGLTASLINSMPKDRETIRQQVRYLENSLHSRCITDLSVIESKPELIIWTHLKTDVTDMNDTLCQMFKNSSRRFDEVLKSNKTEKILQSKSRYLTKDEERIAAYQNRLKLAAAGFSIKPGSFPKVVGGLEKIRTRCGLWHLQAICIRLINALKKHDFNTSLRSDLKSIYKHFTDMIQIIRLGLNQFLSRQNDDGLIEFTRPKCLSLLAILESEYKRAKDSSDSKSSYSCIVFVRSRLEVLSIYLWLDEVSNKIKRYNFIRCDYAIGISATMSSKYSCITKRKSTEQFKTLENFRKGMLNVIITTSVLEEGIDLPTCSTVIRYDEPNTFREYVQSRGRARQTISTFISMANETESRKLTDKLNKFNDFEFALRDFLCDPHMDIAQKTRESISSASPMRPEEKEDYLLINENKVYISSTTAKTILAMYCQRLAKHTPFTEGVRYDRIELPSNLYQTILYLPSGCSLNREGISGSPKTTPEGADNSAIVATIKALHNAKELDDNGIPTRITIDSVDNLLKEFHLKPDFESLEKLVEPGDKSIGPDGRTSYSYEPWMAQVGDYMSKNFQTKTYKLLRQSYIPIDSHRTRDDTRRFFHKSVYGMIVDSSIPSDFIQTHLFSHYGEFRVEYEEISNNSLISTREHHEEYLNFTYKLITQCLGYRRLKKEDFKYHCRFYFVLLDDSNKADFKAMRRSFEISNYYVRAGDIVKLRYFVQNRRERDEIQDRPLFVKGVHRQDYKFPNFRTETSFKRLISSMNLRDYDIIEVVPISKTFAQTKALKTKGRQFVSTSLFYPGQFLQYFNGDPSSVYQAFNLPIQIFNLYKVISVLEFDKKLLEATKERRNITLENTSKSTAKELDFVEASNSDNINEERVLIQEENIDLNMNRSQSLGGDNIDPLVDVDTDESDQVTDDENDDAVSLLSTSDSQSDHDEDSPVGQEYKDLIGKRHMNLNDNDEHDKFQRWDMSQYYQKDLKKLDYKFENSYNIDYTKESLAYNAEVFENLKSSVANMTSTLVGALMTLEAHLTSDATFLNEDAEFTKRSATVDLSIVSKISFDKVQPFKEASPIDALFEGLTLKRAEESYNLECLENAGDSFLKYITSIILFQSIDGNEGFLTSARSRLVSNEHFILLSRMKNLGSHAFSKRFSTDYLGYILGQNVSEKPLNNFKPKDLADILESLVGSYLLYRGEFEALLLIQWLGLNVFNETTFATFEEKSITFTKPQSPLLDSTECRTYFRSCKRKFSKFEEILGYNFNDKSWLVQAFTHASSTEKCTRSYERLEFLGDSLLDFLVTMNLVVDGKLQTPGQVSASRSAIVNNCSFARLAIKYKYDLYILHSSQDLYDELSRLRNYIEEDPEMSFLDMIDFDKVVKLLGDLFESVAGAIYLDSGCSLDKLWSIYYPMMKESIDAELKNPTKNIVSDMHETFPGFGRIHYDVFDVKSNDGSMVGVKCCIKDFGEFEGVGLSLRQAKLRAVQEAMKKRPSPEMKAKLDKEFWEKHGKPKPIKARNQQRGGYRLRTDCQLPDNQQNNQQTSRSHASRGRDHHTRKRL